MSKKPSIYLSIFLALLCCHEAKSQRTDTLYFNANWQICEKPFASYYRFGNIVTEGMWYYQGRVLDYYNNDTLQMEGSYSDSGTREGVFRFYYTNGKMLASGAFFGVQQKGLWEFYHPNGKLKLKLDYAGDGKNYIILEFRDSSGVPLLQNGTGEFQIPVSFMNGAATYTLVGHMKNGKREGIWEYRDFHPIRREWVTVMTEEFSDDKFKEGIVYKVYPTTTVSSRHKTPTDRISLIGFEKFIPTESFAKDPISFRDMQLDNDLLEYLQTRKSPTYAVDSSSYAKSMIGILEILNTASITRFFSKPGKVYGGEVVFTLTDSGAIQNVEVYGNLDDKEKEQMIFFARKFKNIRDITTEAEELNDERKIYFFSLFMADFIPKWYLQYFPAHYFFFSPWPYRATIDKIKAIRKKPKKN